MAWQNEGQLASCSFTCGHCGFVVASDRGYSNKQDPGARVFICPHCDKPTYLAHGVQIPGLAPGNEVTSLPTDIETLYREARNAVAAGASTAAVLVCRKLLAHIAVAQGAPAGESFFKYVEHLASTGYIPPHGRSWVDHIRSKGNEANHEIVVMSSADAADLITFVEMLLKFIYEFPSRVPKPP